MTLLSSNHPCVLNQWFLNDSRKDQKLILNFCNLGPYLTFSLQHLHPPCIRSNRIWHKVPTPPLPRIVKYLPTIRDGRGFRERSDEFLLQILLIRADWVRMPNIFKRFTRHVLIVPGQKAAANLIPRWLCNRMVSRNLVGTLHTTRKGRNFSMTRSLHGRLFTYTFFTRRIFTTTRSFHGWKILCKTYTMAIFWFHCVTKGRPKLWGNPGQVLGIFSG